MKKMMLLLLSAVAFWGGDAFGKDRGKVTPSDSVEITKRLEPVIVYSHRRAEDLHVVPLSVSAFTPSKIEREGIVGIKDVTARIPNFYMPDYGNKVNSPIYIRGIGSKFNTPSVAFYVDNVPYFDKSTFDFDLFDVKSIEIFRGPQGTLFGRNSMGGTVSVYSKEPSSTMRNRLVASYGDYNFMRFLASHSNIYGKVGVTAGVSYAKRDGFFTNSFNGKKVDNLENLNTKFSVSYKPSETFTVKLIGGFGLNNDGGNPFNVYDASTGAFKDVNFNEESYYTRNMVNGAAVLSKKFGDFELRNVTSYQYFQDHQHLDNDYTAEDLYTNDFLQYQNLITDELVFLTPKIGKWSSQTGAFFFSQKMDKGFDIKNGNDVSRYMGVKDPTKTKNIPNAAVNTQTGEKSNGIAFFHQSQFSDVFIKGLNVSLGGRLDYENKKFDYYNTVKLPNPIVITTPSGVIKVPLPANVPNPMVTTKDYSRDKLVFLPKATVSYNLLGQNVYASWGLGYKSGGFNTSYDKNNPQTIAYNPEFAENVEVGIKTKWLDSRLMANLSVFYTDWRDQQINVFLPSGEGLMITNAGHSFTKGAELEVNAIPFTNVQLYGAYGYTVAKFLDYRMNDATVYDGNYLPFVPRSTLSLGGSYRINLDDRGNSTIVLGVDYERVGKHYWNDANAFLKFANAPSFQKPWFNINATVGYTYKNLDLTLRGKNLTNERYNTYMYEYEVEKFQNLYAQKAKPRMVFVELTYRF